MDSKHIQTEKTFLLQNDISAGILIADFKPSFEFADLLMSSGLRRKFKVSFMLGFDFPQKNLFNLQKKF